MSDLLNQASLVYIPSGYKEDTAYSVIPTDGSGDITFTRASDGTRVNSQGLVERVPWNLLQQSNTFSTGWAIGIGGGSLGSFVADPFGGTTAQVLNLNVNGILYNSSVSPYPTTISTTSIWMRTQSGSVSIQLGNPIGSPYYTKTITTTWTRFDIQVNPSAFNGGIALYNSVQGSAITIEIFGAQVNEGSTAKPYFPTTDRQNVPRLDYSNGCPSLLLEKQSTNYCLWSNDLTQSSAWIDQTSNTTLTQITSGGPDGGSFTRLVSTGSGNMGRMVQASSITNPNGATMSVYLKGSGTAGFGLFIGNGIAQYNQITLTNTWTRYTISVSGTGGTYQDWEIDCFGGSTIDVSFVQVEISSYATSPIYTTSASVTRVADAAYKTGISSLIGQTEGTMFVDTIINGNVNPILMQIINNTNNYTESIYIEFNKASNIIQVNAYDSGTIQAQISTSATIGQRYKIAFAYKANDFALYVNGSQIGVDNSGSIQSGLQDLFIGCLKGNLSAQDFNGNTLNQAVLFPTRLTNAELASLTTL